MDKLIAAHQLALLANILAVQNQILQVLTADVPDADERQASSQRIMATAAATLENTSSFLQRLGESEDDGEDL